VVQQHLAQPQSKGKPHEKGFGAALEQHLEIMTLLDNTYPAGEREGMHHYGYPDQNNLKGYSFY